MASRDDRTPITSLHGLSSLSPKPDSIIPEYKRLWKNAPQRIIPPGAMGNSAVINPYSRIGSSSSNPTNPTASRTLLMRKPTREVAPRLATFQHSMSHKKGKAKAIESSAPQDPPSSDIIDVDADQSSIDELDIISERPPHTSKFFGPRRTLGTRTNQDEGMNTGTSLIDDGEHTKRLQVKHETKFNHKLERQSLSPIEYFPEHEGSTRPRPKVSEHVAMFEALSESVKSAKQDPPVIDLKAMSKKSQMRPKGGTLKAPQKFSPSRISESTRFGRPTLLGPDRLPVSMVYIGLRKCPEFKSLSFEDGDTTIRLSRGSDLTGSIDIPISKDKFSSLQFTDPKNVTRPPILYFQALKSEWFCSWQSRFGSDFLAGDDDRKHIAIQFNLEDPTWQLDVYQLRMTKLSQRVPSTVIRSIDSKKLWDSLQRDDNDNLGDTGHSAISLVDSNEVGRRKSKEPHTLDTASVDSAARIDRLTKLRHTPNDNILPIRAHSQDRVSISNKISNEESTKEPPRAKPLSRENLQRPEDNHEESAEITPVEPPPKRRRIELRRSSRQQEKIQNVDADELILVYPYGVPGAVNVTRGDLARLDPEALLNDTLIEFGLKFWLKTLELENPAQASQVYLFNSFFYKKLNKRNIEEGFQSVRKWTSKTDIFSKKYIIIPINEHLHWYFAIIYEPEHILQQQPNTPTPHTNVVTRRQARDKQVSDEAVSAKTEVTHDQAVSEKAEVAKDQANSDEDMQDGTASENEVERMALTNASTTNDDPLSHLASDSQSPSMEASDQIVPNLSPGSPMDVDTDLAVVAEIEDSSSKSTVSDSTTNKGSSTPIGTPSDVRTTVVDLNEVTPARFYGKSFTNGTRKRVSIEDIKDDPPRTKIFILDSIGNKHPQAMKQLNKWLQLEAEDKKSVSNPATALTKLVSVPVQPNFSDCGIYVLHFVQTLMEDPEHYCKVIMMKDRSPLSERQVDWKHATVSTIRDQLRGQILRLSDEWHEMRAAQEEKKKQQQKTTESDEDSDVAIVDHVKASARKGKSVKSARTKS